MSTSASTPAPVAVPDAEGARSPWPALLALVVGFFMLMVDTSILTVATPAIVSDLGADVNQAIWVTSAYLLTYAVPLLVTGRLGDAFGHRRIYLIGLVGFVACSVWSGLASDVTWLIVARACQGFAAALMAPQTMAIITRIFPVERRGAAMALWGATGGVAMLTGPLLGGLLVQTVGWQAIFFLNVPVGAAALVLALRLVPELPTHPHRFDWLGVALFASGMFALVFGVQGAAARDGGITGPTTWMVLGGLVLLALFVGWQRRTTGEALLPLSLFADRNFAVANFTIACTAFAFTSMGFPLMLYAQSVRGWEPLLAGSLMAPMALFAIILAPVVGRLTDRAHPRWVIGAGLVASASSLTGLLLVMEADTTIWVAVISMCVLGVGSAFMWGPLSATANRNLPAQYAGAGAGIFNTMRQVGAVLGAAAAALLIDLRLAAHDLSGGADSLQASHALSAAEASVYTQALAESLWMVPAALLVALVAVSLFERPAHQAALLTPSSRK